ncbi:uncharacterized protein EKO05_0001815 [Ascochyta rabiei]|uniref:Uncharacterized protein n=1 Tax=Didymella rabiei TaxID=5454 RepID=A0A163H457_DIDRA|nr:uncharacterized protein EKO05_0001815 [Ascochyta rabiei]KZM25148.1 hypothetical protein ST47_g3714 [Ascochyta rabiei]UPX11195.1 hypothetical protein EKO05_0001815 [Ascochyta rabiei]
MRALRMSKCVSKLRKASLAVKCSLYRLESSLKSASCCTTSPAPWEYDFDQAPRPRIGPTPPLSPSPAPPCKIPSDALHKVCYQHNCAFERSVDTFLDTSSTCSVSVADGLTSVSGGIDSGVGGTAGKVAKTPS